MNKQEVVFEHQPVNLEQPKEELLPLQEKEILKNVQVINTLDIP
jgi:hypothetical protein